MTPEPYFSFLPIDPAWKTGEEEEKEEEEEEEKRGITSSFLPLAGRFPISPRAKKMKS